MLAFPQTVRRCSEQQLPQLQSTTVYMDLPQAVNQPFIMPTASLKLLLAERDTGEEEMAEKDHWGRHTL